MAFSENIKEKVMVACGRACSICHKFCGTKIEMHHIKQKADEGEDSFENAIPLCFDCHADVKHYNPKHPKGTKYSDSELIVHRDSWYAKVSGSTAFMGSKKHIEIDKATYNELAKFLPPEQFLFLRDECFDNAFFQDDFFEPLENFYKYKAREPQLEYLDADLEKAKCNLADSIKSFVSELLPVIFYREMYKQDKMMRVPKDLYSNEPDGEDIRYAKVKKLDEVASEVWEKYCDYIRLCRRKLKI